MILVRNQIRDMIGGEIGKFTCGRIKYTFRFEQNEYQSVYEILVNWGRCGPQFCCQIYDNICRAEGFELLLAKGFEYIAALTPCKQKIPRKISATYQLDSCFYELSGR